MLESYNDLSDKIKKLQEQQRAMRNQIFAQVGADKGVQTSNGSKAIISRSSRGFQVRTFNKPKEKVS